MKKNSNAYTQATAAAIFAIPLLFFSATAIHAFDLSQLAQAIEIDSNNELPKIASLLLLLAILILVEIIFRGILQQKIGLNATAPLYAVAMTLSIAPAVENYPLFLLYFLATGLWLGILKELEGLNATIAAVSIYLLLAIATSITPYFPTIAFTAFMFLAPFYWMWKKEKTEFKKAVEKLALTREQLVQNVLKGIVWVFAMFFMVAIIGMVTLALGFNDQQKVLEKVTGLPLYILVFAIVVAPISEEVFFRGFLSPRVGIIASAILFALAHFSYGSIVEIIGAFAVGVLLALQLKWHKSLVVPITAHVLFNLISITVMTLVSP